MFFEMLVVGLIHGYACNRGSQCLHVLLIASWEGLSRQPCDNAAELSRHCRMIVVSRMNCCQGALPGVPTVRMDRPKNTKELWSIVLFQANRPKNRLKFWSIRERGWLHRSVQEIVRTL